MNEGPNIVSIAALLGDRARAEMLTALLGGQALTATELAEVAGVTKPTVSAHLARLVDAGLLAVEAQGRHRYFRLADDDVAQLLESLMGVAYRTGALRLRSSPREPALRKARVCYDHLAGDLGVQMLDAMTKKKLVRHHKSDITLTPEGERFIASKLQIDVAGITHARRPLCKACLDWSERRHHLAGTLGAAIMTRFTELKWAARDATAGSRVVNFTRNGEKQFASLFGPIVESRS